MAAESEKWWSRTKWSIQILLPILVYLFTLTTGDAQESFEGPYVYALKITTFSFIAALINYNILLPRFWSKRRYLVYAVFVGMLVSFVHVISIYLPQIFHPFWSWNTDPTPAIWYVLVIGASGFYKDIVIWFDQQRVHWLGRQDKLETELDLLKSQINPHFLFNTLNNIYALAETKDDRAAPMISGLADMMRYIIDDCKGDRVSLGKEKNFIQGYIGLQLLKDLASTNVDFYVEGVNDQHQIAPLILINFVENAFKHGDLVQNEDAWVRIELLVEENLLIFVVANSYNSTISKAKKEQSNRKGIGVTNSKRQLSIHYPNRHQIIQSQTANSYELRLEIEI